MATMVMISGRRKRDDRGRYMEDNQMMDDRVNRFDQRREGNNGRHWPESNMPSYIGEGQMGDHFMQNRRMADDVYRMRDRNVVNIRDYQDRRKIGFSPRQMGGGLEDDEEDREMRQYGRRYDPDRPRMHHGEIHASYQMMGMSKMGDGKYLSREDAQEWVRGMKSEDGKRGGRWTLQEIQQYAGNYGITNEEEIVEFFAVLNALYSDYCKVAKKYGVDKMDFWADMAKAFMHDKDAVHGKVKMYYECIAKKEDE